MQSEAYESSTAEQTLSQRLQQEACLEHATAAPGEAGTEATTHCPVSWDQVLCWPPSAPGLAVIPCFEELNGIRYDVTKNAFRWCNPGGLWANYTNYSQCKEIVLEPPDDNSDVIIFVVGFFLSLAALSVAVWIFIYFRDLRCLRNTIHTNLMFTYIFYDAVWILIVCVQSATCSALCGILIAIYNYFYLTNFFWMFVEGLYLFLLVVATFSAERVKLRVYVLIGWGLPGVIVVTWAIAKNLVNDDTLERTTDPLALMLMEHCPSIVFSHLDWIHQAPVIVVLAVNLVFLAAIMWILITKLRAATTAETQQYRKATKALLVLFPLLGITYILMLQGPKEGLEGAVFRSFRAVLVGLQGFTVALFYCFLNSEVQKALRLRVLRWREMRTVCRDRRDAWGPRSSIRVKDVLCGSAMFGTSDSPYHKRESTVSAATTTTLLGPPGSVVGNGRLSNGSRAAAARPLLPAGEDAV